MPNLTIVLALSPTLDAFVKAVTPVLTSNQLNRIESMLKEVLMDEQQVKDALSKIDVATTAIGNNVTAIGNNISTLSSTASTISSEVDDLETALKTALANGSGVSQDLVDQATALGAKADALSAAADATKTATDALVPVLNGIATKGVINPVPVPVPPPATPVG